MSNYKIEKFQTLSDVPHFLIQYNWHEIKKIGFYDYLSLESRPVSCDVSLVAIFKVTPKTNKP